MPSAKLRYKISPLRHKHSFILKGPDSICGTISLKGLHRGTAVINIEGEEIFVRRTSALRKNLEIKRDSESFYFASDLLSRGEIAIRTHRYKWSPSNIRWTAWSWKNPRGEELMQIKMHRTVSGVKGEIICSHPLSEIWKIELAFIGWYLMLLNHGRPGVHMLSALKVAVSR